MKSKAKLIKKAKREGALQQVAALPYRKTDDGGVDVLVITSRSTKRFIVPKGWPMSGKRDFEAAEIEAAEEAGVKGRVQTRAIGSFRYKKDLGSQIVPVKARVFALHVKTVKSRWKEHKQRKRKWLPAKKAVLALDDKELANLVNKFLPTL